MRRGLLLTLTEPPAGMEEEFNAWYDGEHIPERLSIPGFRSARRWVAGKSYLATYELDAPSVLQSPAYLARFRNPTPWSKRCLDKCVVFKRWACEQIVPGDAEPHGGATGLVFSLRAEQVSGALQTRRFAAESGEEVFLYEIADPAPAGPVVYRLYQP
jgi:hypothetical protein